MYPFWILLDMMEVVVTTGAIRRAKLQSNRHHQQTDTQQPFLSPNQQCQITVETSNFIEKNSYQLLPRRNVWCFHARRRQERWRRRGNGSGRDVGHRTACQTLALFNRHSAHGIPLQSSSPALHSASTSLSDQTVQVYL